MSDTTIDLREGEWKAHRVQQGTRRETGSKGARDRQLMAFTASGPARYVKLLVTPSGNRKELAEEIVNFDPDAEQMAEAEGFW